MAMSMKSLVLTTLALPLVACAPIPPCPPRAAAGPPAATADPAGPKTREQVRAEVMAATADGSINDYNGFITVAREWPGSGSNVPPSSCR
jgi:hypothetical protein